jgi:glycosyltransferase involved in cell wall biosynthesis
VRSIAIVATMISPPGSMGGNTKIALEFARSWAERGCDVCILTTPDGERSFREYGVSGVRFRIVSQTSIPHRGLLSAHGRLWHEARRADLGSERFDVAYSASDFIPDLVLARRLRDEGLASRWIGCLYLFVPHPAFGYDGHYTRKVSGSLDLRLAAFYPYQRLVVLPAVLVADGNMLTNDVDAQEFVRRRYPRERLHAVYGVINFAHIATDEVAMSYDAVFVGRLHPQKGIERLLRIWQRVLVQQPGLRLAIIGVGDPGYERRVRRQARELGLEASISWIGFCEGSRKYDVLRSSRVFLHTSVYDNSGMAAAEALACGLPAVMFDLPPLRVTYPRGVLKAPIGDEAAFAQHVVHVLSDETLRRRVGEEGRIEARLWDSRLREQEATSFIEKILTMEPLRAWQLRAIPASAVRHEHS